MVTCRYFLLGSCRFGENCKYEHSYNDNSSSVLREKPDIDPNIIIKSVRNDMDKAQNGNLWPFSCYGPFQGKACFPGFEDKSFEEIRLGLYEAEINGTMQQYKLQVTKILNETRMKMRSLLNPTQETTNVLKELFNSNSLSIFSNTQDNSSTFQTNSAVNKNFNVEKMKENTTDIKNEIKEIKREIEKRGKVWKKEKEILIDRIDRLEKKLERDEKQKKKNNIIIKGIQNTKEPGKEIKTLFEEQLQIQVEVKEVVALKQEILLVVMPNWEEKQKIMTEKKKLRNTNIYIQNDLTWEERKIQKEIRDIAKTEKGKGKKVKIGYQKLIMGEEVHIWNKSENRLKLKNKENEAKND